MSEDAPVFVRCNVAEAKTIGVHVHFILGKEWHFTPYEVIPLSQFKRAANYFRECGADFSVVEESEYQEWVAEIAAREAEVIYCGDCGGQTKKGGFCWKRVDEVGFRCEHHGRAFDDRGPYEERVERPMQDKE